MNFLFSAFRALVMLPLLSSPMLLAKKEGCCPVPTGSLVVPTEQFGVADMQISSKRCIAIADFVSGRVFLYSLDDKTSTIDPLVKDTISVPGASGLAFSPCGNCLVVTDYHRTVTIFTLNHDGCTVDKTILPGIFTFDEATYPVPVRPLYASFSPNGKCVAVGLTATAQVALFKLNKRCCAFKDQPILIATPSTVDCASNATDCVGGLSYSPNGSCFAVSNYVNNTITLFKVDKCGCNLITPGNVYPMNGLPAKLAFSPGGNCLAVSDFNNGVAKMFSVKDCQATEVPTPNGIFAFLGLAFTKDGNCLLTTYFADALASYRIDKGTCQAVEVQLLPSARVSEMVISGKSVVVLANEADPARLVLRSYRLKGCNSNSGLGRQKTSANAADFFKSMAFAKSGRSISATRS